MNRRIVGMAAAVGAAALVSAACTDGQRTAPLPPATGAITPTSTQTPAAAWRRIADAPTERQEVAAAVVGGKIYVAGGLISGGATDVVEIYDPATDRWRSGPRLPIALHHAMAAEQGGRLFVFGGFTGSLGDAATDRVFVLEDGAWREGPRLRRARGAAAAVTVGGRIVVVGGISSGRHVAPVEIFDGTSWRDRAAIPTVRDHLGAATDGTLVYAAAGRRGSEQFDSFEVYDPAADRWSALRAVPTARSGLGAAFVDGMVLTVGGEGPRMFPEVEAYDVAARTWTRLADLAVPVHGVGVAAVDGKLYALVGGVRVGGAPTNACQVLTVA